MSAQSEARLIQAVHAYLEGLQMGREGWPEELAELTAYRTTPPGPIGLGPGRCASRYVTDSSAGWTDVVQCSKPPGHRSKEHLFTTRPRQGPGETYRWTDEEAR